MRKTFLLIIMIVSLLAIDVQAETFSGSDGWKVSFDGKNMDSNFTTSKLSEKIYSMQPGDTVTFHVDLSNDSDYDTDWYLTNEVIKSLEDSQTVAEGGAYSYLLKFTDPDKKESVLYDSSRVGGENNSSREGLHEATQSMEDWMYLDRIDSGDKGAIDLEVGLDGETQGNAYQDTLAKLQLNFAVEKKEKAAGTDDKEEKEDTEDGKEVIKTGDDHGFLFWSIVMIISGILLILLLILAKKKKLPALGLFLLLFLVSVPSQAREPYTYSVQIFTGNQGNFTGTGIQAPAQASVRYSKDRITVSNLSWGDIVVFDAAGKGKVSLPGGSKYYVKGIREAGRDNNTVDGTAIIVDSDERYVVAYGMKGDMTSYTVKFVDAESGKELAPSREYEAKAGDKPVAAYLYIDGYRPQAYNLTKTLSQDSSKNVFTFEYTKIEDQKDTKDSKEKGGTEKNGTANDGNNGNDQDGQESRIDLSGNTDGTDDVDDEEQTGDVTGGEADFIPQESRELREVEDTQVPLALIDLDDEATVMFSFLSSNPVRSCIIVACAVLILIYLIIIKRKKREESI